MVENLINQPFLRNRLFCWWEWYIIIFDLFYSVTLNFTHKIFQFNKTKKNQQLIPSTGITANINNFTVICIECLQWHPLYMKRCTQAKHKVRKGRREAVLNCRICFRLTKYTRFAHCLLLLLFGKHDPKNKPFSTPALPTFWSRWGRSTSIQRNYR